MVSVDFEARWLGTCAYLLASAADLEVGLQSLLGKDAVSENLLKGTSPLHGSRP